MADLFEAEDRPDTPALLPASDTIVQVPTVLTREARAAGSLPLNFGRVPNKPALTYKREILYPEIVLVRLLEARSWKAAWSKNWHGRAYWRSIGEDMALPTHVLRVADWLASQVDGSGGAWDVVAWKGQDRLLFVESKQRGKDRLRLNQKQWIEAALGAGLRMESFAVVEYVIG